MATNVTCDMCKQPCEKARGFSGIFDAKLFVPESEEGFVRVQIAIQMKTTPVYPDEYEASQSRTVKGLDLCSDCFQKALELMLKSLAEHQELEEGKQHGQDDAGTKRIQ